MWKSCAHHGRLNSEFFASSELRVTANLINRNFQIVLVKDFKRDYSLDYYEEPPTIRTT